MYKIRKIVKSDKERIEEICSKIWEGDDYLPKIFDNWIEEKNGEFIGVEHEGKLVGVSKMTFLTPHDAWLEGLRKDMDFKGKGVGTEVSKYFLDKLKESENLESIRFSTYFKNFASIKLNEKLGFEKIVVISNKYIHTEEDDFSRDLVDTSDVEILKNEDEIFNFIEKTDYFQPSKELITVGWVSHPYSRDFIRQKFIQPGHCIGIRENGDLVGLCLWSHTYYEPDISISFLDAQNSETARKLVDYLLKIEGKNFLEAKVPTIEKIRKLFIDSGFKSWEEENDFIIYEFPLEKL
jgi:N-acetylglutamate synthase-like GNAT family acetyltransferase